MKLLSGILSETVVKGAVRGAAKGAAKAAESLPDIAKSAGKAVSSFKEALDEAATDSEDKLRESIDNTCPSCGAPMDIDYEKLQLVCPYCDNVSPLPTSFARSTIREREKTQREKIKAERQIEMEKLQQKERERNSREANKAFIVIAIISLLGLCGLGISSCISSCTDNSKAAYTIDSTVASYTEHFDVTCKKNLMLSKYDIDIYVDGTNVYTLDHGSQDTFDLEMNEGTHEVQFREHSGSADGKHTLNITGESYITAVLYCTSDQVEIQEFNVLSAEEKAFENKSKEESKDGIEDEPVSSKATTQDEDSGDDLDTPAKLAYMLDFEDGLPDPYTMYMVFDTDKKTVYEVFSTSPDYKYRGTYTGTIGEKVNVKWKDGQDTWKQKMRWHDGDLESMESDDSGANAEWTRCSVSKAKKAKKA